MKTPRRFSNSFRPRFDELQSGEICKLEHHYSGLLRELIGWLDLLASNRPDRFVYCGVEAMVEHCHRYKQPNNKFGKRLIEYALKELRARHIISKRLFRFVDGVQREGFIVAPHDCLCVRETPTDCVLVGQLKASGRWEREIILNEENGKPLAEPKIGPVFWAGYSGSADECAVKCADGDSGQRTEETKVNREKSALTVVAVVAESVVRTENQPNPDQTSQTEQGNSNGKTGGGGVLHHTTDQKQNQTPENIGQHFGRGSVDMDEITEGEFEENNQTDHFDEWDLKSLLQYCDEVIQEWGARLYLGRKTNGDIMAAAMVRFTKQTRKDVPKYWYPIAKRLREAPPQKNFVEPVDETEEFRKLFAMHPVCPDCRFQHPGKPCGGKMRK
jgi:hypothetical protein